MNSSRIGFHHFTSEELVQHFQSYHKIKKKETISEQERTKHLENVLQDFERTKAKVNHCIHEESFEILEQNILIDMLEGLLKSTIDQFLFHGLREILPDLKDYVDFVDQMLQIEGNLSDIISKMDLTNLVQPNIEMVLKIAALDSAEQQLTKKEIAFCKEIIDVIKQLQKYVNKVVDGYAENIEDIAPNISQLVGKKITAQLILGAGGLEQLSKLDSNAVHAMGREMKFLLGMSLNSQVETKAGFISKCSLLEPIPKKYKKKIVRSIANKVILAARCDAAGNFKSGEKGLECRTEILKTSERLQTKAGKQIQVLKAPDLSKRTHRGGAKARALKKKYGMTELRSKKNILAFGIATEIDDYTGEEFGALGQKISIRSHAKHGKGIIQQGNQKLIYNEDQTLEFKREAKDSLSFEKQPTSYFYQFRKFDCTSRKRKRSD